MWSVLYLLCVWIARWTRVSLVRVWGFSLTLQPLCSVSCLFGLWVGTVQSDLANSSLNPFQGSSPAHWKNDGTAVRTNGEPGHFGTKEWRNGYGWSHLWFRSARLKVLAQHRVSAIYWWGMQWVSWGNLALAMEKLEPGWVMSHLFFLSTAIRPTPAGSVAHGACS